MARYKTPFLLVVGVAALALSACGSGSKSANASNGGSGEVNVTYVGTSASLASSLPVIADKFGYFKQQRLNVKFVNATNATAIVQLVASGGADFGNGTPDKVKTVRAKGAEVSLVVGMKQSLDESIVCRPGFHVTGSYPDSVKSLVGKKVGVTTAGSSIQKALDYILTDAGVQPKSVNEIPVGTIPTMTAALESGRIDCAVAYQPMQVKLPSNYVTVVDIDHGQGPQALQHNVSTGIIASPKMSKNADVMMRFATAIKQAADLASDKNNAGEIVGKVISFFPGYDPAVLTAVYAQCAASWNYRLTPDILQNSALTDGASGYPQSEYVSPATLGVVSQ